MKIKTNILIIFFTIIVSILKVNSQTQGDEDIHRKYWYYKSHLNNDFIKVGLNQGESIPFNEKYSKHPSTVVTASMQIDHDGPNLHAGDASARLGIYLSILATEYKLLQNNMQDLTKVRHEIFCALNAINRLDLNAEKYFDAPPPRNTPTLNGFFVRDDVPGDFVKNNYKHFNYYNDKILSVQTTTNLLLAPWDQTVTVTQSILQDHGFTETNLKGVYYTISSWNSSQLGTNNVASNTPSVYAEACHGFEMSQDQAYYLLMGLTLTAKLVASGDTDNGAIFPITATTGQTSLRAEAIAIATRIIKFMKTDPQWKIKNPSFKLGPNFGANNVQTGENPLIYTYALDNLGDFIKNNEGKPLFHFPGVGGFQYPKSPTGEFRNNYSLLMAGPWMAFANSGGGPAVDMQGFFHCLAGSGNNVYDQVGLINIAVETQIKLLTDISVLVNKMVNSSLTSAQQTTLTNLVNALPTSQKIIVQSLLNVPFGAAAAEIAILKVIKILRNVLGVNVTMNVTDLRLYDNKQTNLVKYENTCLFPPPCTPATLCNAPAVFHNGSDQVFGIYLRDILHPLIASPPAGFRFLNTLAAPSHLLIKNSVKSMLSVAPCNGNFNYGTFSQPPDPWGGSCIMDRHDDIWKKVTCNSRMSEMSGLDFMFLHNLYYLTEHTNSTGMKDYIDRNLTVNFPASFSVNVSSFVSGNKTTFGAYEHIVATNNIASNGAAIIRAGKEIALLPGFSSAAGSDVDIIIDPFHDCDWNTSTGMLRVAPEQNNSNATSPVNQNYIYDKKTTAEDKKNTAEKTTDNYLVKIYPNPNDGAFYIKFNLEKMQHVNISVINVLSEEVYKNELHAQSDELPIQLQGISKGMYLVKVKFENGTEFQKRIVTK